MSCPLLGCLQHQALIVDAFIAGFAASTKIDDVIEASTLFGNIAILRVAHRCFPATFGKGRSPIPPETFCSALLLALDAQPEKDSPRVSFFENEWAQAVVDVFLSSDVTTTIAKVYVDSAVVLLLLLGTHWERAWVNSHAAVEASPA